jgi:hypothetical protein
MGFRLTALGSQKRWGIVAAVRCLISRKLIRSDKGGLPAQLRNRSTARTRGHGRLEIGPDLFRHACLLGLKGTVSKHRESIYRGGKFRHWIKVKNRQHPAFTRVLDQF